MTPRPVRSASGTPGPALAALVLVLVLVAAACAGGADSVESSEIPTTTAAAGAAGDAQDAGDIDDTDDGDTDDTDDGDTVGLTATTGPTSTTTTTSDPTVTTEPPASSLTAAPATTAEPEGQVVRPDGPGAFASPSGNILCLMVEAVASCWISEKRWEIEQPDDPFCEESDWGDVIDVTPDEVMWPCYTDFGFDPDAAPLAYGDAMVVGEFRCESARSGVTCSNAAGQGFRLARAEVVVF